MCGAPTRRTTRTATVSSGTESTRRSRPWRSTPPRRAPVPRPSGAPRLKPSSCPERLNGRLHTLPLGGVWWRSLLFCFFFCTANHCGVWNGVRSNDQGFLRSSYCSLNSENGHRHPTVMSCWLWSIHFSGVTPCPAHSESTMPSLPIPVTPRALATITFHYLKSEPPRTRHGGPGGSGDAAHGQQRAAPGAPPHRPRKGRLCPPVGRRPRHRRRSPPLPSRLVPSVPLTM